MKTKIDRATHTAVVVLPSRVVREGAMELTKVLRELTRQDLKRIVFDMTETEMIDSSALGALIHARRETAPLGLEMVLRNAKGYVRGLLENAKFTTLFVMEDTEAVS